MKILLFGGFLGSGKTTIIRAFIDAIIAKELGTIAVIENEIGEVGIDDVMLRTGSIKTKPIFGGCVCCEISGSLIVAVDEIEKQIAPDWLIIELTGVAELANVKELLHSYTTTVPDIATISVADGGRWERLKKIGPFLFEQIMGCDIAVLNKIDICPDPVSIAKEIMDKTGLSDVLLMSGENDRAAACIGILDKAFGLGIEAGEDGHEHGHEDEDDGEHEDDHGHDHAHDDGEHDHGHDDGEHTHGHAHGHTHDHDHGEEGRAGAYSRSFSLRQPAETGREALVEKLTAFFAEIGGLLSRDGIVYGHIKGLLSEKEGSFVRFSLTDEHVTDIVRSAGWAAAEGGSAGAAAFNLTLNLNSMIHTEAEIAVLVEPVFRRYRDWLS